MKGIVRSFADGSGAIAPRDGSADVQFSWRAIQTGDKRLSPGDEVDYECDTTGAAVVVFKIH